jgi:hypothetical protein
MAQTDGQSTVIDGQTYTVYPLDPLTANDILIDLGHVIGPSLGALASASDQGEPGSQLINEAIGGLFKRIEKEKMREIIDRLSKVTEVATDGGKVPQLSTIFVLHFKGRIGALYQWLWFALKVQFKDFFDLAAPAIARFGDLAGAAQSNYPTTS